MGGNSSVRTPYQRRTARKPKPDAGDDQQAIAAMHEEIKFTKNYLADREAKRSAKNKSASHRA